MMHMLALTDRRLPATSITLAIGLSARLVFGATEELSMDVLPDDAGWEAFGGGSAMVDGGFLTIDTQPVFHFQQYRSPSSWFETVNNAWGWEVVFRMRVDSSAPTFPYTNVSVLIDDRTHSVVVGINEDSVVIEAGGLIVESFFMDTTDSFHTYRIAGHYDTVDVFVDGVLSLSTTSSYGGGSPTGIVDFGDRNASPQTPSVTTWDFFAYETYGPVSVEGGTWASIKSLYR